MEIRHNISQNTIGFLVEKILYLEVDVCPKNEFCCLRIGIISIVTFLHFWSSKNGQLARCNNQGNNKQKSSAQDCNFWKLNGSAESGKDAQDTIKIILNTDFNQIWPTSFAALWVLN